MADPSDLKFSTTEVKLVNHYLRNRVYTGKDGFIKDIKLYEDEPWLLPHVKNDHFREKEWFYFVKRERRSDKRPNRTVPGRGGSEGGSWTASGSQRDIFDRKVLIGRKLKLSYHKKPKGKPKGDTTGWCMTEYWLASENVDDFQEVVLCHIREKKKVVEKFQFRPVVEQPQLQNRDNNNNIVSHTLVPGVDLADKEDDRLMFDVDPQDMENDRIMFDVDELIGESTQQQQQQQQQQQLIPLRGQDSGFTRDQSAGEGDSLAESVPELDNMLEEDQHIPLQGQDSGFTMDQYAGEGESLAEYLAKLENMVVEGQEDQYPQITLQGQALGFTMDQTAGEGEGSAAYCIAQLENLLKEDQEDQHSQISPYQGGQDSGETNMISEPRRLVIMEDECIDQDGVYNLVYQQPGISQPQQQKPQEIKSIIGRKRKLNENNHKSQKRSKPMIQYLRFD